MGAIATESLLKQKKTYLEKVQAEIQAKTYQKGNIDREINQLKSKEQSIKEEIKKLTTKSTEIIVSEHAILRYFERVLGFNLDDIKKEICTEEFLNLANTLGNGTYPIGESARAVVKNNVIVTIE